MRPEVAYQSLVTRRRFVVVDVETTPSDDGVRVISIGLVPHIPDQTTRSRKRTVKATQSVGARSWLLDPGAPIETASTHGITDADVAGCPKSPTSPTTSPTRSAGWDYQAKACSSPTTQSQTYVR